MEATLSQDSLAFGYAEFHQSYTAAPLVLELLGLTGAELTSPAEFCIKEPRHVCVAALHGHFVYPPNAQEIRRRVLVDTLYPETIRRRIEVFKNQASAFNQAQRRQARFAGGCIQLDLNDGKRFTQEEFDFIGLGSSPIAKAAMQYEHDRLFETFEHGRKLNHFAQEYGFPNIHSLEAFVERLDVEAQAMGYPSYGALCISSRYLRHLETRYGEAEGAGEIREALAQKRHLLVRHPAFIIDAFITCRSSDVGLPFDVDVNEEGVQIELRNGSACVTWTLVSQHLSDKSPNFHDEWFS